MVSYQIISCESLSEKTYRTHNFCFYVNVNQILGSCEVGSGDRSFKLFKFKASNNWSFICSVLFLNEVIIEALGLLLIITSTKAFWKNRLRNLFFFFCFPRNDIRRSLLILNDSSWLTVEPEGYKENDLLIFHLPQKFI